MEDAVFYGAAINKTPEQQIIIIEAIIEQIKPRLPMVTVSSEMYREVLYTKLKTELHQLKLSLEYEKKQNYSISTQLTAF